MAYTGSGNNAHTNFRHPLYDSTITQTGLRLDWRKSDGLKIKKRKG